jgi:hypothetical protein
MLVILTERLENVVTRTLIGRTEIWIKHVCITHKRQEPFLKDQMNNLLINISLILKS